MARDLRAQRTCRWVLLPALLALACGAKDIKKPEGGVEEEADAMAPPTARLDAGPDKPKPVVPDSGGAPDAPQPVDVGPDGPPACVPACGAGQVCMNGQCQAVCMDPQTLCGTACSDTATDPRNCGMCGKACLASEFCSRGMCVGGCGQGETKCGQSCVNLATDRANCGVCGKACAGAEACVNGACQCVSPNKVCDTVCQSLINNRSNCGMCGNRCTGDLVCRTDHCDCPSGRQKCPNNPLKCVTSANDCCPTGQVWCTDRCTTLRTDSNNCGACGRICPGAKKCSNSQCSCPTTQPHECSGDICLPSGQCCTNETKCADNSCVPNTSCCAGMRRCSNNTCIATGCCLDEITCGLKCLVKNGRNCCMTEDCPMDTGQVCNTTTNRCVCPMEKPKLCTGSNVCQECCQASDCGDGKLCKDHKCEDSPPDAGPDAMVP